MSSTGVVTTWANEPQAVLGFAALGREVPSGEVVIHHELSVELTGGGRDDGDRAVVGGLGRRSSRDAYVDSAARNVRQMSFDQWVLDSAVSQRTAWLVDVVDVITDSGGTLASWLIATLLTIVLLVRGGLRTEALLIAGSMLTGLLVMSGLKRIFTRTRPPPAGAVDRNRFVFVPVGPRDDERDPRDFGCRRDPSSCLAEAREDGNAREPRPVHDRRRILPRLPGCPLDDRCTGRLGVRMMWAGGVWIWGTAQIRKRRALVTS